jgi:hypothetical protein
MIENTEKKDDPRRPKKKAQRTITIYPLVLSYVATALETLQHWKQYLPPWPQ